MDCRTARSLLAQDDLSPSAEAQLAEHLASCRACADDHADPIGLFLRQTELPLAHPPPSFVANVIARLPQESPLALQQRVARRAQARLIGIVLAGCVILGIILGMQAQLQQPTFVVTTPIGGLLMRLVLVAKSVLVLGSLPMVLLILGAALLMWQWGSRLIPQRSAPALSFALVALALVVVIGRGWQRTPVAGEQTARSVAAPLVVSGTVTGDVISLAGDITVRGIVTGDVITLAGHVELEPGSQIGGSVLSGRGTIQTDGVQIAGGVVDGLRPIAGLAQANPSPAQLDQKQLTRLGSIFGALITLALAGLWIMLQPERMRNASTQLLRAPLKALAFGAGALVVLAGLAIGGVLVLAATVIGVILIPVVLLLTHLPFIQGIATVGQALGRRLIGSQEPMSALWGIGIQTILVIVLAFFAPLASLTVFYLLGGIGLGAVLLEMNWRLTPS